MKKVLYILLGSLFLGLGAIGIVLPILPTTPFLLLSAFFYVRSSDKLYQWLIHHKVFGAYIYHYMKYRAIPLHAKIIAVVLIGVSIGYSIYLLNNPLFSLTLSIVAILMSWYIIQLKTYHKTMEE